MARASAVEGLKIDAPALAPVVVPVTIAILVGLFLIQRKGTEFVGRIFGPAMLVWFVAIGVLGLKGIVQSPAILAAISPHHACAAGRSRRAYQAHARVVAPD